MAARTTSDGASGPPREITYVVGVKTVLQGVMELVTWNGRAPLP